MKYSGPTPEEEHALQRSLLHYDHLKALDQTYRQMREEQTFRSMMDRSFGFDEQAIEAQNQAYFASLVIRLPEKPLEALFDRYRRVYTDVKQLLAQYHPECETDIYFQSAHITVKALTYGKKHSVEELQLLRNHIAPVVEKWLNLLGPGLKLHARGIFSHLGGGKGLSMGISFYPNNTLIQMIRGEVGATLYTAIDEGKLGEIELRPEAGFHTLLTHSTNFRARGIRLPFHAGFMERLQRIINQVGENYYGSISGISLHDFYIGNCQSDKYIIGPDSGHELSLIDG